ncbi:hypothetical protein FKW31_03095 [Acetobacter sp. DmW_136]|uniref:hypothetical protein n=1 Tax=Acetobacter sp. DmW_136 TaxID=2591091 RepID=UPI0012398A0F|nr:hypothetical protein [Acetobacter sp. DmW_136]KAA8387646.1 hypothetical protein FKW31_03095 [Acetobacter sp. DmW_136]
MGEAKFTPGVWGPFDNGNFWEVEPVSNKYRGGICHIHDAEHIGGISQVEQVANARLIGAAPELYEALDNIITATHNGFNIHQNSVLIVEARAALAKASGETS